MCMIDVQLDKGINLFMASNCDVNIVNNFDDTALIKALRLNMDNLVARLLDKVACYQRDLSDIKVKKLRVNHFSYGIAVSNT